METIESPFIPPFQEAEWLKMIFLLSDTQNWLNELVGNTFLQVPIGNKKKLFHKTYYITVTALAHILEKHYYKINRHPDASKFTIPVADILCYLRDAFPFPAIPVSGTINTQRTMDTGKIVGFDRNQYPTSIITIVTAPEGRIITAYPGNKKA